MSPTFWKEATPSGKVRRALKTKARKANLTESNREVRTRDKSCRVPMCGCRRFRLRLEVSHRVHQGAGGNQDGSRNDTRNLILVCAERHKDNPISIDKGALKWEPIYPERGANGPVRWFVDAALFVYLTEQATERPTTPVWFELAYEAALGQLGPMSPQQVTVARALARMEL